MARLRTCYASTVVCSDEFQELPPSAQLLYFFLGFEADADGALDGVKMTLRKYGASMEDLTALRDAGYLLDVDGVLFIRAWWLNNNKDSYHYHPGLHATERAKLTVDDDRYYCLREQAGDYPESASSLPVEPNIRVSNQIRANVSRDDLNQSDLRKARCPNCGFESLSSVNELGELVIDCHNCDTVSTVNPLAAGL